MINFVICDSKKHLKITKFMKLFTQICNAEEFVMKKIV